jgi:hypothetical protein
MLEHMESENNLTTAKTNKAQIRLVTYSSSLKNLLAFQNIHPNPDYENFTYRRDRIHRSEIITRFVRSKS